MTWLIVSLGLLGLIAVAVGNGCLLAVLVHSAWLAELRLTRPRLARAIALAGTIQLGLIGLALVGVLAGLAVMLWRFVQNGA